MSSSNIILPSIFKWISTAQTFWNYCLRNAYDLFSQSSRAFSIHATNICNIGYFMRIEHEENGICVRAQQRWISYDDKRQNFRWWWFIVNDDLKWKLLHLFVYYIPNIVQQSRSRLVLGAATEFVRSTSYRTFCFICKYVIVTMITIHQNHLLTFVSYICTKRIM